MSSISIVGTANMASVLASRALVGGNAVEIVGCGATKAKELAAGSADGRPLDVFIAGDDAEAKEDVSAFVESRGMRPLDTGQLSMARALENATLLHLGPVAHSVKHTNFFLGVNILS